MDKSPTPVTTVRTQLYVFGDVDRVREQIDRQLLAENLPEVARLSQCLTSGIINLASAAKECLSADIIMAGGDEVLFVVSYEHYSRCALQNVAREFTRETGCTISFGVAETVALAYLNLRRAKANGGNAIVGDRSEP